MNKKKICIVAGARPNFMKIAPIIRELEKNKKLFRYVLVHTGQHYDAAMSDVFFRDLDIPAPDYCLNVGSGSHACQTAAVMVAFEKVCLKERPDLVMVVGDVNSTVACSLVAKKLHIGVAHVEAGLRSGDMRMPEEVNRVVTDSITDLFFLTEQSGHDNLVREGRDAKHLFLVGNVMIDNLFHQLKKLNRGTCSTDELKRRYSRYACLTLHRPSNVDDAAVLGKLIEAIETVAKKIPVIFPIHPRTKKQLRKYKIRLSQNIIVQPSLSYREFLNVWKDSMFVMTDSGGLQEETTALGIPCFTLRENTERPVTISDGTNMLIGRTYRKLITEVNKVLRGDGKAGGVLDLWDGKASERIVDVLKKSRWM